jgi:ElaB/YqjD/DUF883 family membrane-anchored ribosome-binding protein
MTETTTNPVSEFPSPTQDTDRPLSTSIRQRVQSVLDEARPRMEELRLRAREEMYRCDDYVRTHPYQVIGVAALVGAAVGILVSRRFSSGM